MAFFRPSVPLGGACPPSGARSRIRPQESATHHHCFVFPMHVKPRAYALLTPRVLGYFFVGVCPPLCAPCWPAGLFPVLAGDVAGACKFRKAWAGLWIIHRNRTFVVGGVYHVPGVGSAPLGITPAGGVRRGGVCCVHGADPGNPGQCSWI